MIEIERRLDNFLNRCDYIRFEHIFLSTKGVKNADYISRDKCFIVELKVLKKNYFVHGGLIERFQAIIPANREIFLKGGITHFSVPDVNREGELDNFEEPIRRILKKGNRQIRESKAMINKRALGIMLFVLTTDAIHPDLYVEMIYSLLSKEFHSVDGFILVTTFAAFKEPNTGVKYPYSYARWPTGTPKILVQELARLSRLFYHYFKVKDCANESIK